MEQLDEELDSAKRRLLSEIESTVKCADEG
jgi:hypothetical protein